MRRRFSRAILILVPMLLAGPAFLPVDAAAQTARSKKLAPKEAAKKKKEAAAARDAKSWNLGREASGPVLFYGKTQNEDVAVSFTCLPEAGLVRVIAYGGARGVRPGDGARVRLTNGPARLEVAAIALPNEKNSRSRRHHQDQPARVRPVPRRRHHGAGSAGPHRRLFAEDDAGEKRGVRTRLPRRQVGALAVFDPSP